MPGGRSPTTSSTHDGPHRLRRGLTLAAATLAVVLSTGCLDNRAPLLTLAPAEELLMSAESSTVVVRNTGGQVLNWRVVSDDHRVRATPSDGSIFASGSMTVTIGIDSASVDKHEVLSATLMFRSNGGDAQTLVLYSPDSGIGRCAGFLPYELPLHESLRPLRRALPGASAVPVGNEILVAYRTPEADLEAVPLSDGTGDPRLDPGFPEARSAMAETLRLRAQLQADHGLVLVSAGAFGAPDLFVSAVAAERVVERLLEDPRVRYAQRNYYLELQDLPNDPFLSDRQWNLTQFGVPQAWAHYDPAAVGDDVVLAILDSGIYGSHPDLAAKLLPGWDFHGRDPDTEPGVPHESNDAAHGTHVAGIAAAAGDDGVGVAGVAYGSAFKIVPVKVFDDIGSGGTISGLVQAIRWSAGLPVAGAPPNAHPADVINMSLGVAGRHPALEDATLDAWNAGAVLIAAAGNHNAQVPDRGILSPGNAPCVIAVGSVDDTFEVSEFSNHGPQAELVAPGGYAQSGCRKIYSTVPPTPGSSGADALYGCLAGTSMAAPFVSGVAALLVAQGEHLGPAAVRTQLSRTALLPQADVDHRYYGNGVVCADAALGAATRCGGPAELTAAAEPPSPGR